jgi:hypothetical protein
MIGGDGGALYWTGQDSSLVVALSSYFSLLLLVD